MHARASERLRSEPELIDKAEQRIADVIVESTQEINRYASAAEQILKDNGVTQGVRYGTISPYCGTYLELIMKADRLMACWSISGCGAISGTLPATGNSPGSTDC